MTAEVHSRSSTLIKAHSQFLCSLTDKHNESEAAPWKHRLRISRFSFYSIVFEKKSIKKAQSVYRSHFTLVFTLLLLFLLHILLFLNEWRMESRRKGPFSFLLTAVNRSRQTLTCQSASLPHLPALRSREVLDAWQIKQQQTKKTTLQSCKVKIWLPKGVYL